MIIRIYSVISIYFQLSKTEQLAELHWVKGLIVLEKSNSICLNMKFQLLKVEIQSV